MKSKARPRWNFSRMKLAEFTVFAQGVVNKMTGNIHFQNPVPDLQTIQNAVNKLNQSVGDSINGDTVKIAIRNNDRKIVEQLLRALAGWVFSKSTAAEIIITSGLPVAKGRGAPKFLGPPRELTFSYVAGKSGLIALRWKQPAENRAAMFVIEQTCHDLSGKDVRWERVGFSKKCRFSQPGLIPAKRYSWRVYGIGSLGPGGMSLPVSAMAI